MRENFGFHCRRGGPWGVTTPKLSSPSERESIGPARNFIERATRHSGCDDGVREVRILANAGGNQDIGVQKDSHRALGRWFWLEPPGAGVAFAPRLLKGAFNLLSGAAPCGASQTRPVVNTETCAVAACCGRKQTSFTPNSTSMRSPGDKPKRARISLGRTNRPALSIITV